MFEHTLDVEPDCILGMLVIATVGIIILALGLVYHI